MPGLNLNAATTGFRHDLALRMTDFNRAPAGVQAEIAADRARRQSIRRRFPR